MYKRQGVNPKTGKQEERRPDDSEPFSGLVFKVVSDKYVGRVSFVRVYSGKVSLGETVYNPTIDKRERVSKILLMHANKREEVKEASAGDIVGMVGLRKSKTGDTLCALKYPIMLESPTFPEPVISVAIEPKTKADQDRLGEALNRLADEDPTFRVRYNEETGQTVISGMGELHLEIIVDRLLREFDVKANVGTPRVSYRETIRSTAVAEGRFVKQTGGRGQYGHVRIVVEPLKDDDRHFEFIDETKMGIIPKQFIPAVEKGVREAMECGVVAGYPVIDVRVKLIDGSYHEVDSSELAFRVAGSMAFRKAMERAKPVLLEPVMDVVVETPKEYVGDIVGDMNARKARIVSIDIKADLQVIRALVPLREMFGYATTLRSLSQGRAVYAMQFHHYEEVPPSAREAVLFGLR